ncbi:MAG: peptidase inhibitor family I36 protein [Pseudonocardiaceae bacterium]
MIPIQANQSTDECPDNHICFYSEERFLGPMESREGSAEVVNLKIVARSVKNCTSAEVFVFTASDGQGKEIRLQAEHSYSIIPGGGAVRSFTGGIVLE